MGKKGNITGEVFDTEVIKQIEARQNFLGADFKQDKQLIYQNNKTAFVRLASSIDIGSLSSSPTNDSSFPNLSPSPSFFSQPRQIVSTQQSTEPLLNRNLPLTLSGDNLAKQCVLFGGVVSVNTDNINAISFQPKFGVGENTLSPKGFGDQEIDLTSLC